MTLRTFNLRSQGRLILAFLLLGVLPSIRAGSSSETTVPEEVQNQLISIQEGGVPTIHTKPDDVAAVYENQALPQYVFEVDGVPIPKNKIVARMQAGKFVLDWFVAHSRTFIRMGDTIVVMALFDYAETVNGVTTQKRNTPFTETFVLVDGNWRLLSTVWTRNEMALPSPAPAKVD